MFRFTYILAIVFWVSGISSAQEGHRIEVELSNYDSDTLMLAYYFWDKQYIKDTAFRKDDRFIFSGTDTLPSGIYLLVTQPQSDIIQIVLDDEDQHFTVRANADSLNTSVRIEGCEENKLFYDYLDFLSNARQTSQKLQAKWKDNQDSLQLELKELDDEVLSYQQSILSDRPESMTAFIINASQEVKIPEFTGPLEDIRDKQYRYYVKHFFDPYDFKDERWMYSAFLHAKIDKYLKKVIVQVPDTINKSLDMILSKFDEEGDGFKRVLVHYLNEYATSEYVGMDAVYVHLVMNYYAKGKAPWTKEEQLQKMIDDAGNLEPILIGKQAPEITVFRRDKTPLALYDVKARYTILLFWAPDCSHCKKKMPKLVDLYPEIKKRDAELIAICTKLVDKEPGCWEYLDEHGLDGPWLTGSDQYLRSRFKQKYNVTSTPQVFILDENKKIVSKKIGIDQLIKVLDTLEEIRSNEG